MEKPIRIVVLGDTKSGKSSIIRKYMGRGFKKQYLQTLGKEISTTKYQFTTDKISKKMKDETVEFNIQVIEVSETQFDDFLKKDRNFIGFTGIIMVFDLSRFDSYIHLTHQLSKILQRYPKMALPMLIIANKREEERTITDDDVMAYVRNLKEDKQHRASYLDYAIISAKEDDVTYIFEALADAIIDQIPIRRGKFVIR